MYLWFFRHILKLKKYMHPPAVCNCCQWSGRNTSCCFCFQTCLRTPAKKHKYKQRYKCKYNSCSERNLQLYRWLLAYCVYHQEITVHWCDIAWHQHFLYMVHIKVCQLSMLVHVAWKLQNSHSFQIALSDCDPIVVQLTNCAHMHPQQPLTVVAS